MSTQEILSRIKALPFSDQIAIMEEILKLIRAKVINAKAKTTVNAVRLRRQKFKVRTFDLGEDVRVDRDEIYSERGM